MISVAVFIRGLSLRDNENRRTVAAEMRLNRFRDGWPDFATKWLPNLAQAFQAWESPPKPALKGDRIVGQTQNIIMLMKGIWG